MLQHLEFGCFFQRPLVPIGKHDENELEAIYFGGSGKPRGFTHWLIALMWEERYGCGWKVIVFPVKEGRAFWLVPPLFHTDAPSTFNKAWKLTERLKTVSMSDKLTEEYANPYWDDWSAI